MELIQFFQVSQLREVEQVAEQVVMETLVVQEEVLVVLLVQGQETLLQ